MSLLKSPSWARVVDIYRQQAQSRLNEVANVPVLSMDEALNRNYKLGIAHGLVLAARLPNDIYEELRNMYVAQLEELRDEPAATQ